MKRSNAKEVIKLPEYTEAQRILERAANARVTRFFDNNKFKELPEEKKEEERKAFYDNSNIEKQKEKVKEKGKGKKKGEKGLDTKSNSTRSKGNEYTWQQPPSFYKNQSKNLNTIALPEKTGNQVELERAANALTTKFHHNKNKIKLSEQKVYYDKFKNAGPEDSEYTWQQLCAFYKKRPKKLKIIVLPKDTEAQGILERAANALVSRFFKNKEFKKLPKEKKEKRKKIFDDKFNTEKPEGSEYTWQQLYAFYEKRLREQKKNKLSDLDLASGSSSGSKASLESANANPQSNFKPASSKKGKGKRKASPVPTASTNSTSPDQTFGEDIDESMKEFWNSLGIATQNEVLLTQEELLDFNRPSVTPITDTDAGTDRAPTRRKKQRIHK